MMEHKTKKIRSGSLSEINVTPLVDVPLVLLIIFMVTSPTVHHGARLPTPDLQPSNAKENPTQEEKDTLTLTEEGILKLRGKYIVKKNSISL